MYDMQRMYHEQTATCFLQYCNSCAADKRSIKLRCFSSAWITERIKHRIGGHLGLIKRNFMALYDPSIEHAICCYVITSLWFMSFLVCYLPDRVEWSRCSSRHKQQSVSSHLRFQIQHAHTYPPSVVAVLSSSPPPRCGCCRCEGLGGRTEPHRHAVGPESKQQTRTLADTPTVCGIDVLLKTHNIL